MTQQQGQLAQTDQTPLLTHGFAEPLTFAHQWVSLRLDTPSSDLQEEVLPEEEVVVDSQEEPRRQPWRGWRWISRWRRTCGPTSQPSRRTSRRPTSGERPFYLHQRPQEGRRIYGSMETLPKSSQRDVTNGQYVLTVHAFSHICSGTHNHRMGSLHQRLA